MSLIPAIAVVLTSTLKLTITQIHKPALSMCAASAATVFTSEVYQGERHVLRNWDTR